MACARRAGARFPIETLRPIGVRKLVPNPAWPVLLSPAGVWALKVGLPVGLALLVLGLPGYRLVALLTCAMLTFYQGLLRGLTFTNHAELPLLYATWVLALFPAPMPWPSAGGASRCAPL